MGASFIMTILMCIAAFMIGWVAIEIVAAFSKEVLPIGLNLLLGIAASIITFYLMTR